MTWRMQTIKMQGRTVSKTNRRKFQSSRSTEIYIFTRHRMSMLLSFVFWDMLVNVHSYIYVCLESSWNRWLIASSSMPSKIWRPSVVRSAINSSKLRGCSNRKRKRLSWLIIRRSPITLTKEGYLIEPDPKTNSWVREIIIYIAWKS